MLPNAANRSGTPSCCPVGGERNSLQVENLAPGSAYRFRVTAHRLAGSDNVVIGESDPVHTATVPSTPGPLILSQAVLPVGDETVAPGAIFDLRWGPPENDGGDLIRGYRIWANISSLNATGVVLVHNTSDGRPESERDQPGRTRCSRTIPLLPGHTYSLAAQAWNAVGGGALGPAFLVQPAPIGPSASYELPVGAWRRGIVGRGAFARHRAFLPVGVATARIVVQQATSALCCATLRERQKVFEARSLRLYVQAVEDAEPRDVIDSSSIANLMFDAGGLHGRMVNASGTSGEVSLEMAYPTSSWISIVVHGFAIEGDAMDYDIRVEAESNVAELDVPGRQSTLAARWRNTRVAGQLGEWSPYVIARHLHPQSARDEDAFIL